jgi:hypothetical protein
MVIADIGTNRKQRMKNIGGIEATAETYLDYGKVNFLCAELFEGERGDYFKKCDFFFTSVARCWSTKAVTAFSLILRPLTLMRSRRSTR